MPRKLDVQQTLFDLYRAHYQEIPEYARQDLTKLSTFIHGYHSALQHTITLEQALQIAEKEDIHSSRSETLRAMKSIYDWTISPTHENLNNLLERVAETHGNSFNSIYVYWETYSPVLLDFGPILLKHKLFNTLEISTKKEQIKGITEIIFAYPDKELKDYALSELAAWQKRTNA